MTAGRGGGGGGALDLVVRMMVAKGLGADSGTGAMEKEANGFEEELADGLADLLAEEEGTKETVANGLGEDDDDDEEEEDNGIIDGAAAVGAANGCLLIF